VPDRRSELVDLFVRDLDRIELPARGRWRPTQRKEPYLVKASRLVLYAGGVAAVILAAPIVGLAVRDRNAQVASSPGPTPAASAQVVASSPPATPSPTVQAGAITGRFGYGSDFIPPATVYAINTTDPRVWYSVDFAGLGNPPRPTAQPGTSGDTYTITGVAPGMYWVVAYRNDPTGPMLGPDPGYYSRQPDCFRARPSGPCPDLTLVPVTVIAGQTTSGIDILTWGTPPGLPTPSPSIPPRPTPRR
jgi:hypothetical protein